MNVVMKAALVTGCVAVYVFVETGTRDQLSRLEDKIDRVETRLTARIDRVETRLDRVEARLDRVETKIDEVIGYLRYRSDAVPEDSSPSGMKQ
ncbi:MAG: hypothetical protein OXO51_02400 [Gemmatimonadota bacterium]|nr:hypothetical protein [Gemmatimonadota bacterium]